jgi:DNA topoisomerase-1
VKLIIVESPAKAKALQGFLGHGYKVMASMGHIRDLPYKELGVDVEHEFHPPTISCTCELNPGTDK